MMTGSSNTNDSGATRARVQRAVSDLLPGESGVEVVWAPGAHGGHSGTRGGRPVITISDRFLDRVDVALFIAAHEAGHIGLGHLGRRAHTIGVYLAGFATCLIAGSILAVSLFGRAGINLAPLSILVWVIVQRPLLARLKQPQELAADAFAARAGHPLTADIRAVVDVPVSRGDTWAGWVFPTHPSWSARLAATARHVDQGEGHQSDS